MADGGTWFLVCVPLYINEVLEEACALVNSRARAKNIRIVRDLDQETAYLGAEAFLHQLFLIFLANAITYSLIGTSFRFTLENGEGVTRADSAVNGRGFSVDE